MGTVLDGILIALGILCVVLGFVNGAVRSLIGLVGLIVGAWLAPGAGKWLADLFAPADFLGHAFAQILCTAIAFAVIQVLVGLIGRLLNLLCKLPGLNLINRILGGVVGAVKGVLLVMVLCVLLRLFLPVLAQKYPDQVKLESFSDSQLVKLPAQVEKPADSQQRDHNPLYSFYQQFLREGIDLNAKEK